MIIMSIELMLARRQRFCGFTAKFTCDTIAFRNPSSLNLVGVESLALPRCGSALKSQDSQALKHG
jgi:hypothetical protein